MGNSFLFYANRYIWSRRVCTCQRFVFSGYRRVGGEVENENLCFCFPVFVFYISLKSNCFFLSFSTGLQVSVISYPGFIKSFIYFVGAPLWIFYYLCYNSGEHCSRIVFRTFVRIIYMNLL